MVIKRRKGERLWGEKIAALEETLKELNKENKTIPLGGGCYRERKEGEICLEDLELGYIPGTLNQCIYKLEERKIKLFNKYEMNILATIKTDEDNNLILRAISEENVPILEKICQIYERKTLKDEPIIEY